MLTNKGCGHASFTTSVGTEGSYWPEKLRVLFLNLMPALRCRALCLKLLFQWKVKALLINLSLWGIKRS